MPNDLIRYDLLVQEALCGVVSKVLADVARHGLPGDHHFYITFRTRAPGVRLSSRMRELYPEEMTIILQHQFEDLKVTEHGFEVGLSFKGVPEMLLIPFDAMTGFFDPSVQFSLKFEPQTEPEEETEASTSAPVSAPLSKPQALPTLATPLTAIPKPTNINPAATVRGDGNEADDDPVEEAKVVSIDAFRKKP